MSSTLSSFSQIAIDAAKKNFEGLSLNKEMNKLNNTFYKNDEGEFSKILQYKFDKDNPSTITVMDYIKDYLKHENNPSYEMKYELINEVDNLENLIGLYNDYLADENEKKEIPRKLLKKIRVYEMKMIVPYFFQYIAKDNSYRIPTKMDCAMDYLEEVLDELNTKAIKTDKVEIKDLLVMQKNLDGREYNRDKVDESRRIIANCQSALNNNYYSNTDDETEMTRRNNIRKWSKKLAVKRLQELKLNAKTVYRIVIRAFDLDKNYKGHLLNALDENGEPIVYVDCDCLDDKGEPQEFYVKIKEFKEMTMTTLALMYYAYPKEFIKCFKEKQQEVVEYKRFWK